MQTRLSQEEEARQQLAQQKKKIENELNKQKQDMEDFLARLQGADSDKVAKEQQIANLKTELAHQEDLITRQSKEKKALVSRHKFMAWHELH